MIKISGSCGKHPLLPSLRSQSAAKKQVTPTNSRKPGSGLRVPRGFCFTYIGEVTVWAVPSSMSVSNVKFPTGQ